MTIRLDPAAKDRLGRRRGAGVALAARPAAYGGVTRHEGARLRVAAPLWADPRQSTAIAAFFHETQAMRPADPNVDPDASHPEDADATRAAALDRLFALRDAGRREERMGDAVVHCRHDRPLRAEGVRLPDGVRGGACCVAWPVRPGQGADHGIARALGDAAVDSDTTEGKPAPAPPVDPLACVWSRRLAPDDPADPRTRRGRLVAVAVPAMEEAEGSDDRSGPAVAGLRFVDDPEAEPGGAFAKDAGTPGAVPLPPSLERDLARSAAVAARIGSDLFAGLLYGALCNTEWRHWATGAVWSCSWRTAGGIVAHLRGEGDYIDWYCHGGEGLVDEAVLAAIEAAGWDLMPMARAGGGVDEEDMDGEGA